MVSQVQREVGKHLPATLEKGPYTVILAPVREAVERQCKQLQEAVTGSQSRQARQDMLEIESQLAKAKEVLSTEVTSIRDIGDVRKQMPALREAADAVAEMLARIRQRNRLIAEIAQSSGMRMEPIDTSALEAAAEEIEAMRQRREGDLEEKRKQIVGTLEARRRAFLDHVVALRETWRTERPQDGAQVDSSKVFAALEEVSQRAAALAEEAEGLQADCEAADVEGVDLEGIQALAAEVAEERADWERYAEFCRERDQLFRTPWMGVRERARNEIEDFLAKWRKTLQQRAGRFGPVERTIQGDLERYEVIMPHLQYIQGVSWEPQHWSRLFSMLGMPKQDLRSVTLLDFLERTGQLASCGDEIKAMDARAQAEYGLRKAMAELTEWGATRSFSLVDHEMPHQGKSLHLIKEWKDLLTEVGDLQALVGSLKQSPYFADSGIADSASGWDARLTELSGALLLLNDIQRRWVYLEPIFSRGALPSEQGRFGRVDREFQTLMTTISREPGVKAFADRPGLGGSLKNMATQLEHCQRALMEFLEERRSQFPRFYFIGDDDLLEVLSQSRNPQVIQTHLKKLFAGIFSVEIEDGAITHMCSSDGERVPLASPVRTGDQVEAWLSDLEQCMRATLQGLLSATTQEPGGRGLRAQLSGDDFQRCSSQVLCLSEMVRFTEKCEAALKTGRLKALEEEIRGFLAQYTAEDYAGQVVMQLKVKALVLDTIHHLDILTRLQEARADSPSHWEWDKQLRFYLRAGGLCDVFMASSKVNALVLML